MKRRFVLLIACLGGMVALASSLPELGLAVLFRAFFQISIGFLFAEILRPAGAEEAAVGPEDVSRLALVAVGLDRNLKCVVWSRGAAAATGLERSPSDFGGLPFRTRTDRDAAVLEVERALRGRPPRPFPLRLKRGDYTPVSLVVQCVRANGGVTVLGSAVDDALLSLARVPEEVSTVAGDEIPHTRDDVQCGLEPWLEEEVVALFADDVHEHPWSDVRSLCSGATADERGQARDPDNPEPEAWLRVRYPDAIAFVWADPTGTRIANGRGFAPNADVVRYRRDAGADQGRAHLIDVLMPGVYLFARAPGDEPRALRVQLEADPPFPTFGRSGGDWRPLVGYDRRRPKSSSVVSADYARPRLRGRCASPPPRR